MSEPHIYQPEDADPLRDGLLRGFWAHREALAPSMTFIIGDVEIHREQGNSGKSPAAPRAACIPGWIED